ncbi:xylitol oxidase [Catalinimonas alkaloidigena]|uniref:Xylitol oxidase n=1 Tax=Catalinimonas alkaloidigena TaxID=1075417 RepID=A0A1G9KFY7_9BACT|nr:FAD-binding protein [Catalinimonas alkaloidigena]SDL48315.1 xylitol oxidase [Catalinimonas alkaloidigena]
MQRRTFVKLTSSLAAGSILAPLASWKPNEPLKNWAGNIEYSTTHVSYPQSVAEVQQQVKALSQWRTLGSRHCFNRIADSQHHLVSLQNMKRIVSLDKAAATVTVEGGVNYGELSPYLHEQGFAVHNLASLPHITVVGACTTATHGSGWQNGNLATAATALQVVTPDGSVRTLSAEKDGEAFRGAVVGLGALGAITHITLRLEPTFTMRQYVYEHLPMAQLPDHFEEIMSAGYSVSLFTDWTTDTINEVWIKALEKGGTDFGAQPDFYGAKAATKNLHPIAALSAIHCTDQLGVPGPWYERLPHFKMGFTPSSGEELQAEYFVPRDRAVAAIQAVAKLGNAISPHLFISEIRAIDADDLWMSPCYQQPSIAIHFTWKPDWPAVRKLLPKIEQALAPFHVKPHWGKLFTLAPKTLQSRYPRLADFKDLIHTYDPQGKLHNEFIKTNLFG